MFCVKCGQELSDGSIFCSKCGNRVNEIQTEDRVKLISANTNPQAMVERKADNAVEYRVQRYCLKCGQKLTSDATYCPMCVNGMTAETKYFKASVIEPQQNTEKPNLIKLKALRVLSIIGIIVCFSGLVSILTTVVDEELSIYILIFVYALACATVAFVKGIGYKIMIMKVMAISGIILFALLGLIFIVFYNENAVTIPVARIGSFFAVIFCIMMLVLARKNSDKNVV